MEGFREKAFFLSYRRKKASRQGCITGMIKEI
jgi:hypothetical protein